MFESMPNYQISAYWTESYHIMCVTIQ